MKKCGGKLYERESWHVSYVSMGKKSNPVPLVLLEAANDVAFEMRRVG